MVSSWDGCWGCSCSAIIDAGAAHSVLFVGSVKPLYCVAAVWVSFKFVFVFSDLCICCQSASSVCVSLCRQWPSHCAVQQMQVVSRLKKARKAVCLYIEQPWESCSGPALRHKRDFNIATAHRQLEAMQVFIQFNKICSCDTGLCSRWKWVEY